MKNIDISCDICDCSLTREEKPDSSLQIGDKIYDVCAACKAKLTERLEGKGTPVQPNVLVNPY